MHLWAHQAHLGHRRTAYCGGCQDERGEEPPPAPPRPRLQARRHRRWPIARSVLSRWLPGQKRRGATTRTSAFAPAVVAACTFTPTPASVARTEERSRRCLPHLCICPCYSRHDREEEPSPTLTPGWSCVSPLVPPTEKERKERYQNERSLEP